MAGAAPPSYLARVSLSRRLAVLLINHTARRAHARGWLEGVRAALAGRFHLELAYPRSADELSEAARTAGPAGGDVVIVAGGDGTVSAAAHGLAGSGVPMGILPLGTANDLARELGIPRHPEAAARHLAAADPAVTRDVDLGVVNGRHFCTVGGVGIISHATLGVATLKGGAPWKRRVANALGGGIYRLASTAIVVGRRDIADDVHLRWTDADDGASHERRLRLHTLFACNHRTLGGGLRLPSGSRADDGVMELCLVPEGSRAALAVNLARLSAGRAIPRSAFEVVRATSATIETRDDVMFVADGDRMAAGRRFEVGVRPGALRLVG